jgi:hypothetical protein
MIADQPQLLHPVAGPVDHRHQSHLLGDVVTDPPEVDDIAALSQGGCLLD